MNGGSFIAAEEAGYGLSPEDLTIWFGIIASISTGTNTANANTAELWHGVLPFLAAEAVCIAFLLAFAALCLWLQHFLKCATFLGHKSSFIVVIVC